MFDALAQRVEVLPSSTFLAGQQPPDDDAVAALLSDSRVSAAGARTAALATAPASTTRATAAAPASAAMPLLRSFTCTSRVERVRNVGQIPRTDRGSSIRRGYHTPN